MPRGLALGLLFSLPAAVGAIGAITGKRSLLAAAATMAALGSVVAFSGVTLVFLVPAVIFAAAATDSGPTSGKPVHVVVLAALTIPVAALAALAIGIFAIPLFVLLLAAIGAVRGSRHEPLRVTVSSAIVAIVIVCLWIGSGWALSMTESQCWVAYSTESGIAYRSIPTTSTIELGPADLAGGCDSGTLTRRGAGLAAGLALLAVGVAAIASQAKAHPHAGEAVA